MVNVNMYSLIHHSACSVSPMQYVLHYKAQVISARLPPLSEHDLLQAAAPVSLKRHGPGVD